MNIRIISDGGLFHLTIGDHSVWMNLNDIYYLLKEIIDIYKINDNHPLRLRALIDTLKEVSEEYGGKTIDNIIQQLEARVKEHEQTTGA